MFLLTVAAICVPVALSAQNPKDRSWRSGDDGFWERKNLLSVGIANISGNGFDFGFGPLTIAYDRRTGSGITVGGMFHVARNFFTFTFDGYQIGEASLFAMARVGYDLKVARRLYLRFGLGAGVGLHEIYDISHGDVGSPPPPPDLPHLQTLPHLMADIHWVWRVGRHTELAFAPLVISPSQIIFSPWDNEYFPAGYYGFNILPVRLGVRF